jgi:hypothetical protein
MSGMDHPGLKTEFAWDGTFCHPGTLSQAAFDPSKKALCGSGFMV